MQKYRKERISINGKMFTAIIADSIIKKMIGLMFRNGLPASQCMLFVFPREGHHGIWMRNMLFSIDVVWLDKDMRVVDIKERMRPCKQFSDCIPYSPRGKAKYVIEFSSGTVKRLKIRNGGRVRRA